MRTYAEHRHVAAAGVARARHLGTCAMPAAASWSIPAFISTNVTDPKPRPRALVSSQ